MNNVKIVMISLLAGILFGCQSHPVADGKSTVDVDWPTFVARQDLYWKALPQTWMEAPFVGNGLMGSMVFQQDENSLVIQVGRGDVQDHRTEAGIAEAGNILPDQTRLPIGFFTLNTVGKITGCDLRLNLWDAEISGTLMTDQGEVDLTIFIHSDKNLLVARAQPNQGESSFEFDWHPEEAFCHRIRGKRAGGKKYRENYLVNPAPVVTREADINLCVQDLLAGGQTTTAWIIRNEKGSAQTLIASVGHSFPESTATAEAKSVLTADKETSVTDLLASHRIWWHAFYPTSFVSIPDARMESFFWIQHYKMACATKGGHVIADNQGVWLQPTSWPALWWNLNVQLAYSHMLPANHPELSVGLLNNLVKHQDNLVKNVPESMRHDSIAINTVSGQDLLSPMKSPLVKADVSMGNMTWAMHNCYMQYRYTMDEDMLRDQIYPLLKKSINFYRHTLSEGTDGKLHLPKTGSPEYPGGGVEDCTYDLSLIRWGCQTLIKTAEQLGIEEPLVPEWHKIMDQLVDYPIDETGLMIGKDRPYAVSHRHYSHLLMFYPLAIMDLDNPTERALAEKSLLHWQSLPNALAGYSFSGSSSMFALLGNGEMAESRLQDFLDDKILCTTFYKEGVSNPVIETPPAAARSIEDMLIQSWDDKIIVFPAVPTTWKNAAFADLRTEGAFLVSAVRENGATAFVTVKSLAGAPCRVQTGIKGELKVIGVDRDAVKNLGKGVVEIDLPKGETVLLADDSYNGRFVIKPVTKRFKAGWRWGVQ